MAQASPRGAVLVVLSVSVAVAGCVTGQGHQAPGDRIPEPCPEHPSGRPTALYDFNGSARDLSGSNHHGTLHGGAYTFGGVLDVDGTGYMETADDGTLSGLAAMTASACFRARRFNVTDGEEGYIISKNYEGDGSSTTDCYCLSVYQEGKKVQVAANVWARPESGSADRAAAVAWRQLQPGTWYHVAMTYDRSMLRLYLDGEEIALAPYKRVLNANTGVCLRIGVCSGPRNRYFDGLIDDVMILDRALSAEEIRRLAGKG